MNPHRQLLADYAESGSEEAFRELVTAYIGFVHGCALRMVNGNTQLAEDIAQTVFNDLARQAKTLSPEVMIGGWLHRRTCFAAATAMRGERRRLVREREAFEMNALNFNDPDEALAAVAPVLDDAINQLGAEDRDAIVLRFFEQWNLRAIGEVMGTTEAAAQKRVQRALEKLRDLLMRRGVVMPVAALALAVGSASASAAPVGLAATISASALTAAHVGTGFSLSTLKIMALTKLQTTVIVAAVAVATVGTVATKIVILDRDPVYTPSAGQPDPTKIMREAEADTAAGRYKEAEGKFIWYRDNALKFQPSLKGVRDSFALSSWAQLAEKYPPAKKKLRSIRDEAVKQIRHGVADQQSIATSFIVMLSINNGLKDQALSLETFKWLDVYNQAVARQVYHLMEMQLVSAKEYALCDHYLDADNSYGKIYNMYLMQKKQMPKTGNPALDDFAEKYFSNKSARLVALLAINKHADDAERIAMEASKEVNTPEFTALLAEAKSGKVPASWPPGAPN
jgi:RNA polymerase sigma factor (sigma-70 family)